jgi:TldD protein
MGVNYNNRLSLIRENLGGKGGFNILKNLNSDFKRILKSAEVQSKAETLKSGIYPVILDTKLSGLFLHEAVGHLFEADYLCDNIKLSEFMMTGNKIASDCFSAWDDATIPNANGSYEYDDQGVKSSKTELIRNGKIISYLHDKETAHFFNQKETGNSRALNFYYHPQVRMSNTYISPGEYSLDELMKKMDKGFYLKGTVNGETGMENFSFRSAEAFAVKNGCIDKPVIAPLLTGNIFKTLKNIEGCSSKMKIHTGFCGKNGQIPLPVSFGGPEILVDQLVLG